MSHLRKVGIRGYRSILRANLDLGEITVVIGPSDTGKSNVPRALRDWAFNATGTDFVTHGQQVMRVAVAVGDDKKILWEKSVDAKKRPARYVVVDASEDTKQAFEKIGSTVPPEVQELTGIRAVEIDDLSLKIQFGEQGDPWFLLDPTAWSPGRVSKVIGRISGVEALLLAHRDLVNEKNSLRKEIKAQAESVSDAETELVRFEWLDQAATRVAEARELQDGIDRDRRRLQKATELLRRLRVLRARQTGRAAYLEALRRAVGAAEAVDLHGRWAQEAAARSGWARLDRIRERAAEAREAHGEAVRAMAGARAALAALADATGLCCPLCGSPAHPDCRAALRSQAADA